MQFNSSTVKKKWTHCRLKLQELLLNKGLQDVATAVDNNEVTGQCLLELTEGEIKKLAPKIGDRVKLRKLINECQVSSSIIVILTILQSFIFAE